MRHTIIIMYLIGLVTFISGQSVDAQQAIDISTKCKVIKKAEELYTASNSYERQGKTLLAKKYEKDAESLMSKEFKVGMKLRGIFHAESGHHFGQGGWQEKYTPKGECSESIRFLFYTMEESENYGTKDEIALQFEKLNYGQRFEAIIELVPSSYNSKEPFWYTLIGITFRCKLLYIKEIKNPEESDNKDQEGQNQEEQ